MNSIREPRDYIWVLPLIGGVLILISFFTPALYADQMGIEEYYWMWGLWYGSAAGYGSDTLFIATEEPSKYMMPIFYSGLIPAVLILIGSIILIASSNAVRTGRRDIKNAENGWIGMGIMMIVASIIYIIAIDITVMNYVEYAYGTLPPGLDLWDVYEPGFAVIAPFIGAVLSISGSIASKTIKPRREPIFVGEKKEIITKKPIGEVSHEINFCSECGHQLLYKGSKFCSNCGSEIKY
ncbi:MAG: zinc ribbon domain-containing protein [Candidatus Hodarchaeota archaeon]